MKTSELLRLARDKYLAKSKEHNRRLLGVSTYLCVAIEDAASDINTDAAYAAGVRLVKRIDRSLGTCVTVLEWLMSNGHATKAQLYTRAGYLRQAAYDYRHRWITAMIAEYEAKGD